MGIFARFIVLTACIGIRILDAIIVIADNDFATTGLINKHEKIVNYCK